MADGSDSAWFSKFGGMWIDRGDFEDQIAARLRDGRLSRELEAPVRQLQRDGYAILPAAVSERLLERFERAVSSAFRDGHDDLILQLPSDGTPRKVTAGMDRRTTRIVDCYPVLPSALDLFSAPALVGLLAAVFDETPMLFQSLSFDMSSEQGLHQDTAYVVLADRPMEMLACWIALEDVHPDAGPLEYLVGSHRLGDFEFNGHKHWNPGRDGHDLHDAWGAWIRQEGARRGMPLQTFNARRGDILVWHADLAHGGRSVVDPARTRKSLVGHFCPVSSTPNFMALSPDHGEIRRYGPLAYSSGHYKLSEMNPTQPPEPQGWLGQLLDKLVG